MRHIQTLIFLTLTWLTSFTAAAKVLTFTSSQNLVTGERCYVTFIVEMENGELPERPTIEIKNATFKIYDTAIISKQGRRYSRLTYSFNSPKEGTYTIPKTSFTPRIPDNYSEPITLTVKSQDTLTQKQVTSEAINPSSTGENTARKTYTYYTQINANKNNLYPNEATLLEYKIYFPKSVNIAQWGLPTGKKENATSWRFETPDNRSINGDAILNGKPYQVARFYTTASGIKPGKATLGSFKTRIVLHAPAINRMGSFIEAQEAYLLSEKIQLNILDLPPNPPADFRGDVGDFQMSVTIETKPELTTSESIKAEIILAGRGKFSEITPPSLTNAEHWKLISESKRDLGDQRKNINAFAEFTYLIQPSNSDSITSTPGFSFSYLDPDIKAYRTLTHPGVPVTIKRPTTLDAVKDASELTGSNDQMLSIITEPASNHQAWYKKLPISLIHIIPALICLTLLLRHAQQKRKTTLLKNSHKTIQHQALTQLEKQNNENFLKSATNYIQRWVDTEKHPQLKDIQQLRDDLCYKPDQPIKLSEKRKKAIIDSLKKLTILLFFITPQLAEASADTLWKNGDFSQALKTYQSELPTDTNSSAPADLLYNIGNCHQKLDQPGQAALFYHRALLSDPYHTRAKHNLSLIQNQQGSIISNTYIKDGSLQDKISILSLTTYYIILSLSLWIILIAFLWIKILKPKNSTFIYTLAILSLFAAPLSAYAYLQHPDKEKLSAPPFAIIIHSSPLTEQPITNSSTLTTAPPASECHIVSTRGTYTFIQLANKTTGWTLTRNLKVVSRKTNE